MITAATNTSWTIGPGPVLLCLALTVLYCGRWRTSRAKGGARAAPVWRLVSFLGGVVTLVVALISPVDALAEQVFGMHMVQHVLLIDVAPILLILGLTKNILRPLTPRLYKIEQAAGPLGRPVAAIVIYVAVMWIWHVPAFYDAALEHPGVHVFEHVTFLSAGMLYWWHLLSPVRSHLRFGGLAPVGYMAVTKVFVGLLGIGLTFSPDALYSFYEQGPRHWGLSALDDQALAGAIMAVEQSIVMGVALVFLFIRALSEADAENEREERYAATESES
ncbi:MAG TPA: cytochrome c oxidase assembly protein [Baekduia sp.]|nr:cytochrome c oxidase assembly protein [Baekduia sp.]